MLFVKVWPYTAYGQNSEMEKVVNTKVGIGPNR
jgi:hypothetical protein